MADNSTPKKRKWYSQNFKQSWLEDAELKDWLRQDAKNPDACYCVCCNVQLKNANKSMLIAHKNTTKHKKSFDCAKSAIKLDSFLVKKTTTLNEKVAKAELLITGYFAEHHVPFTHINHLSEICKKAFPDSEIAKNLQLKKTKLTYIMQDGIAHYERNEISEILRKQKFSILIDESTDVSVTQILAIVVRFFDEHALQVKDALLDTVVVENGSSQGLYKAVKSTLTKENIPMSNIIGFASDNCSTMMGNKSGFQKLLKDDIPAVFVIGCVCHSFALCSSHAVKVLPSYLESFLKDLTSYFGRSSKRQNDFKLIQSVFGTKDNKIPKLSQTRWLSRENVIKVIIEQWDALVLYFQSESRVDKVDGAKRIYETMINKGTKHMLLFLEYILKKVNALNVEFQSEHFRLHLLHTMVSCEYQSILSCFIKEDVLISSKLSDIDLSNAANHKDMNDIYLGGRTMSYLVQNPIDGDFSRFKTDCINFLIELCSQIRRRLPLDENGVFTLLKILDPKVAQDANKSPQSIIPLALNFPSIAPENTLNELDDEWRSFRHYKDITASAKSIPEFWYSLRNLKDGLDHSKFERLSQFMINLIVLPHSSACVERIFSLVNCTKTKFTNRLKAETVTNRLLAKQAITRKGASCISWEPNSKLTKEIVDGTCHHRYTNRMSSNKEEKELITIEGINEGDEDIDMYTIDN